MDLVIEMLVQSVLADVVSRALTAPRLEGVEGLEVLDRCGFRPEDHSTFVTTTVRFFDFDAVQGQFPQRMTSCKCHMSARILPLNSVDASLCSAVKGFHPPERLVCNAGSRMVYNPTWI